MSDADPAEKGASACIAGQPESHTASASSLYCERFSPADKVVIAYLIIIAALIAMSGERVNHSWRYLAGHAAIIAVIALMAKWSRGLVFIRGWYPAALIPMLYKELEYLIPRIHPQDFDWQLAAIDHRMFGAHPTVWLERVTWPMLTEILQLSYITYYFLPLILGAVLWVKGRFNQFHFLLFVVVFGFFLSYLGYIAVPATGPRFILADRQSGPLTGVLLFDFIRQTLDRAEGITRDCFPSGHTELTLLVLYYGRRFHRRTFWWLLPFGSALIVSTVYLRYHYVIDVIAGALLALAVILMAKPLYNLLGGKV